MLNIFNNNKLSNSFKGNATISFTGALVARLITFLSIPFLTRVYSPEIFGVWPLLLTMATFLIPLATFRYEIAIILPRSRQKALYLVWIIIASTLFVVISSIVLIIFFRDQTIEVFKLPVEHKGLITFIPVIIFLTAMQLTFQAWLARKKIFNIIAISQILQATLMVVLALGIPLFAKADANAFVYASIISLCVAVILTFVACFFNGLSFPSNRFSLKQMLSVAVEYKVYPLYMTPYSISAGLIERVFQLALAGIFSIATLGIYFVARQLVFVPVSVFTSAIRQVFFSYISSNKNTKKRKNLIENLLNLIRSIQMPILAYGIVFSPMIVGILFDNLYDGVADFVIWLIIPASILLHTAWLDRVYDVLGKQRLAVFLQIVSDIIILSIIASAFWLRLDAVLSVAIMSIAIAIYNIIWLWITLSLIGFSIIFRLKLIVSSIVIFLLSWFVFASIFYVFSSLIAFFIASFLLCAICLFIVYNYYKSDNLKNII